MRKQSQESMIERKIVIPAETNPQWRCQLFGLSMRQKRGRLDG
jgi:hypothetical protein